MNKKSLYGVALTTLSVTACLTTGAFATEGITTGEALRDCLQDTARAVCVLNNDVVLDVVEHRHAKANKYDSEYTFYTNLSIDIKDGRTVVVDLNGHDIAANIPINIENGNLDITNGTEEKGTISFAESRSELRTNEGWPATHADVHPQFKLTGSGNSELTEPYSVLNLGKNVEVTSANTTYSAVRVDTGSSFGFGADRSYGAVVNILGANFSDIKTYAVYVDDSANLGINGAMTGNVAKINIDYGSVISTAKDALVSNVYANWNIKDATIKSQENVISMKGGNFVIGDEDSTLKRTPELSTEGEGKAVFNVEQSSYTDKASIEINGGVFQSTGEGGVFYSELDAKGIGEHKALGGLEIKNGAFTADDLFATGTKFDRTGFISGGTWSEWDEESGDGKYVQNGYLKDLSQVGNSTVMTVGPLVAENIPEGYRLELTRFEISEDEETAIQEIIAKSDKSVSGFENDGVPFAERMEIVLYHGSSVETTLPDDESITLRFKPTAMPEIPENHIRKYAVVSEHGDGEVVTYTAKLNEKTGELVVDGIDKFSDFYAAYDDEELVDFTELDASIEAAEDEEEAKYTAISWDNMQEKLAAAKQARIDAEGQLKSVAQGDVDAAQAALDEAVANLDEKADKSILQELVDAIEVAEACEEEGDMCFVIEKGSKLEAEYLAARALLNEDFGVSQQEIIDEQIDELTEALFTRLSNTEAGKNAAAAAKRFLDVEGDKYTEETYDKALEAYKELMKFVIAHNEIDDSAVLYADELQGLTDALNAAIDELAEVEETIAVPDTGASTKEAVFGGKVASLITCIVSGIALAVGGFFAKMKFHKKQ